MTPDPFAEPVRLTYRLVQLPDDSFEGRAVKTETFLGTEDQAYRVGFGYAAAQARSIIASPSQTHADAELDGYHLVLRIPPQTPDGTKLCFERLNRIFQTYHRPLFLIVRPGESIV